MTTIRDFDLRTSGKVVTAYLLKPFELDDLVEAVERISLDECPSLPAA